MNKLKRLLCIVFAALFVGTMLTGCGSVPAGKELGASDSVTRTTEAEGEENPVVIPSDSDMSAYLFLHFIGEGNEHEEQIYFSLSKDGTHWETANGGDPVLEWTNRGNRTDGKYNLTGGVRDPHILRSPKDGKFYMIATDLSIYYLKADWTASQREGSQGIVIWESTDLVNWSEPKFRKIARDNAGCTWAPEVFYDDQKDSYIIVWASKTAEDDYGRHRQYCCYTKDFDHFTEPEVYIESTESVIDATFIKEGDTYYRFVKDEHRTFVYMEKGDSLSGTFTRVRTFTLNGKAPEEMTGYEGPTIYKLNGQNKWCLLLDNYGKSAGYKPFVTDDLATGKFVSGTNFNYGGVTFRHGTVLPITQAEYNALAAKYGLSDEPIGNDSGDLVVSLDFDGENLNNGTTRAKVENKGTALGYTDGPSGKALSLRESGYLEISAPEGGENPLKGLTSFTVSFAYKYVGKRTIGGETDNNWLFFAAPNANKVTYNSEKYVGVRDMNKSAISVQRWSNNGGRAPEVRASYSGDGWHHATIVFYENMTYIYIDGEFASSVRSKVNIATLLGDNPVIYFGKATWDSGEFSNEDIDSVKIYNYALGAEKVAEDYRAAMGIAE